MKNLYLIIISVCLIAGCSSEFNYDLGYAAVIGDVEKMKELIAGGAEVNSEVGKDEVTPLEYAIKGGAFKRSAIFTRQ